jgi:transposase-like protein
MSQLSLTSLEASKRYLCKDCRLNFIAPLDSKCKRYSKKFIHEVIKRNVEDNTSLRATARRMDVSSAATVLAWVNEAGRRCKSLIETNIELNPSRSGILGLDGKPVKING